MELLDFTLPRYARTQWATRELKEEWEPKVQRIISFQQELAKLAVMRGIFAGMMIKIKDSQLENFKKELSKYAAFFFPMKKLEGQKEGEGGWLGALSLDMKLAQELIEAEKRQDQVFKSGLLGIPECCRKFHTEIRKYSDPIWQFASAGNEVIKKRDEHFIRISRSCNHLISPLLRYVGIRILPYVPCSPECKASIELTNSLVSLAKEEGKTEIDDLINLLEMPAEWNVLKGIAYISTPIFKIETSSVACYPNYIVQKEGTFYPEGAPYGLKFPWNEIMKKKK